MFDKEYSFRGTHADKVIMLTAKFDGNFHLFQRNFDVYLISPLVGFLYSRKAELNTDSGNTTKIFPDILIREQSSLKFNYRIIMLLDKTHEPSTDERVNKAFRYFGSKQAEEDEKLYESYVRGGIDVLYDKLVKDVNNTDDYLVRLYDFLEDLETRYNKKIDINSILDLCQAATSM